MIHPPPTKYQLKRLLNDNTPFIIKEGDPCVYQSPVHERIPLVILMRMVMHAECMFSIIPRNSGIFTRRQVIEFCKMAKATLTPEQQKKLSVCGSSAPKSVSDYTYEQLWILYNILPENWHSLPASSPE